MSTDIHTLVDIDTSGSCADHDPLMLTSTHLSMDATTRTAAGLFVVATIFASACVALYETIQRFINPQDLSHLWALAAAGVIGFLENEIAAFIRYRVGRRLASPALVADGNPARVDGFVSLGVVVSATLVALGYPRADPIVGMAITLVILKITWDSWRTIRATEPGEMIELHEH